MNFICKFTGNYFMYRPIKLGVGFIIMVTLTGCAMSPPAPWQRGDLAKSSMKFDADRLDLLSQQHVYFSKEAASGGAGVGGGGCGCN